MVEVPVAVPRARPWKPAALEMEAIAGAEEVQRTNCVRSWVLPSEKAPVATKGREVAFGMVGVEGVTLRPVRRALVTVRSMASDCPSRVAVMVAVPTATPRASPWLPLALETVAVALEDEDQATWVVRSCVEPSE